ncbi:uncharacterized protein LOC127080144 [Lathyrus oleraceus]|uniref:uncharacterized protein LOC127080144 n=1 Tax=Pisum sativum TaxID=3888 RepID=UPI0021D2817B|nr:uncharacterized protein LOC127080144 [Pisum sativum]
MNSSPSELEQFSNWTLKVGDGKLVEPNDGYVYIDIPTEFFIMDFDDPLQAIVQNTYPYFVMNYKNETSLQSREILAGTIEIVDLINHYVLEFIPGEEKEYLSSDSVDTPDGDGNKAFDVLTPEFLNTLRTYVLPNHKIKLKIDTPIVLLRNIDQSEGKNIRGVIYITRMDITHTQSSWPFKMIRRKFPIIVCYAMTINKSQGQSLDYIGIYFPRNVFSHDQLYVAISRVKSKKGLKILIHDKENQPLEATTNVIFKEVFENVYKIFGISNKVSVKKNEVIPVEESVLCLGCYQIF